MDRNLHDGHRERVRKEFLRRGFDEDTPQHKVLEFLLFYSIPRKDTNSTAHLLLETFGTIADVIDASPDRLLAVKGVTENTVALIKLFTPIARIYFSDKSRQVDSFKTMDEIGHFLVHKHFGYSEEVFAITGLNAGGKLISFDILETGDISSVGISTRKVIEIVIKKNITCAVISHNHPSGIALPSAEDIKITKTLKAALEHIGVRLLDHIIVAGDDFISMYQSQKYKSVFVNEQQV